MVLIDKLITKRTTIYFPLSVTAFFAILDLLNKIWDLKENNIAIFSWQHINKGFQVLLGYFAITILTTATCMFLQQYNGEEENYADSNGNKIFISSLGYCIFYAVYIVKFYKSIIVSGCGIIITVSYALFIFKSLSKSIEKRPTDSKEETKESLDVPVLDTNKC